MKILNFGSCNVDYVYSLDHIAVPGETEATQGLSILPGGKGLNQSIAIRRAGNSVYHAGCIGDGGEFLLDLLKENDVDVSFVDYVNAKNGHAVIQVSKAGDNAIFLYSGSNYMISTEQVDKILSAFSKDGADAVATSGCSSSVGAGIALVCLTAVGACALTKKKKAK